MWAIYVKVYVTVKACHNITHGKSLSSYHLQCTTKQLFSDDPQSLMISEGQAAATHLVKILAFLTECKI